MATDAVKEKEKKDSKTTNNSEKTNVTTSEKNIDDNFEVVQKKSHKATKIVCITILALLFLLIIMFLVFTYVNYNNQNIVSGVSIKGVDVSGLSIEEATETIQNYIDENLPENIELTYTDYETSIPLSALEVTFDVDTAVSEAYQIGKNDNVFLSSFEALNCFIFKENIDLSCSLNEEQLRTSLDDISSKLPDTVIDSGYYIEDDELIITSGSSGSVVDVDQMTTYIKSGIANLTLKGRTLEIATQTAEPSEINIEKIYEEIYKEPVDAYYTSDPYAVYPSETGLDFAITLDEAKALLEEEQDEYVIPLNILSPSVTTDMLGLEAFPDLISSYSTKYATSNTNRTTNLRLAAEKINGTVLMPGETFSYNQVVGERTIEAGYKEAAMYVEGEVVDGVGGGICQVTSTLYNAVLYANLGIVERSNHQFVPSYVTASRDATVVYGSIDFKFTNTRDYAIKIVCSVSGGICKFEIYGLKSDNEYEVQISSYVTSTTSTSIYSEAYRILKQNGVVVSKELLSKDTYLRSSS